MRREAALAQKSGGGAQDASNSTETNIVSATHSIGVSASSAQASAKPMAPVRAPVLPVSGVAMTNGMPSFTFTTAAGCNYRLDYKNALTDTNWMPGPWSTNSTGSRLLMTLTDPGAAGQPQRFYRLEAATP